VTVVHCYPYNCLSYFFGAAGGLHGCCSACSLTTTVLTAPIHRARSITKYRIFFNSGFDLLRRKSISSWTTVMWWPVGWSLWLSHV